MTILTGDYTDAAVVMVRPPDTVPPADPAAGATCGTAFPHDSGAGCGAPDPTALPEDARLYKRHVEGGETIRALARETGCHASTILRRIRRFESRRDDPLVDGAVERAGSPAASAAADAVELRRVLRRLAEPGAVLAVAAGMDKAIVTRADVRTAVLDRRLAEVMALRGWVALAGQGRITRHKITAAGRAALRAMVAGRNAGLPMPGEFADAAPIHRPAGPDADGRAPGMAEAQAGFDAPDHGPAAAQAHRVYETRILPDPDSAEPRRMRVNIAENPLLVLARRRDANGQPFLDAGMIGAAERLREDFELAQMGPRVTQNWDGFMTAGVDQGFSAGFGGGSEAARNRVAAALRELGPGMGDMVLRVCCFLEGIELTERRLGWAARSGKVVLRVCCFLEGIELTERRLGWAARSGKVVLRLALMRLDRHYQERYGHGRPLIG